MKPSLILALSLLLPSPGLMAAEPTEQQVLRAQRAEIEATLLRESQACEQRFAINACLDEARARRIAALKPLQTLENLLDARLRTERVQAQRERVEARQHEAAADEGRKQTEMIRQADTPASAPAELPAARTPRASPTAHAQATGAKQAAAAVVAAQARRAQTAERQKQQLAHQADVKKRAAERLASGKKPAAPLPLPGSAAASSASAAGR